MLGEDDKAAELEHSKGVGFLVFPAVDQSPEIAEPGKEALDFPAPAVTTQFAPVLGILAAAIVLARRDELDVVFLPEALIQWIAVISAVSDHSFRFGSRETLLDGGFAELKLASMKVSDKSILPRARRSSASACKRPVRVPSRCHR
jgi:hypothetical protein